MRRAMREISREKYLQMRVITNNIKRWVISLTDTLMLKSSLPFNYNGLQ